MYDYYDSFDCEIGCEEYYGEDYNLWEEEQCFLDEEWEDADFGAEADPEDSFLDGYWESLTEVGEW